MSSDDAGCPVDDGGHVGPPDVAASQRLLRYSWVAGQLHGVSTEGFPRFCQHELGVRLAWKRAWRSAEPLQDRSAWAVRKGRKPAGPRPGAAGEQQQPAMWPWMTVDEPMLGLLRILFRFPNDGLPRPGVRDALIDMPGIKHVIETSADRELLAVALVRDLDEAANLRARLEDHAVGQAVRMDIVSFESHMPARRTWLELARQQLRLDRDG